MKYVLPFIIIACFGISARWKKKQTFPVTFTFINEYHNLLRSKDSLKWVQHLQNMRMADGVYISHDSITMTLNADSTFVQVFYESGKFGWEEDTIGHGGYSFYHPDHNETIVKKNYGTWTLSKDTLKVYYERSYMPDSVAHSDTGKFLLRRNKLYFLFCFEYWGHIEKQRFRRRETRQLNVYNSKMYESCSRWFEYRLRK